MMTSSSPPQPQPPAQPQAVPSLQQHIDTYCDVGKSSEHTHALNRIILHVHGASANAEGFLAVITAAAPYMTHTDDSVRERSVQLLADMLQRLPYLPLDATAVDTTVAFVAQKLTDGACAPAALRAAAALARHHWPWRNPEVVVVGMLTTMFEDITVQALPQAARHHAFTVLYAFCDKTPATVMAMGDAFVHGVIQAVDGERDPRNLVICFTIVEFVLRAFAATLSDDTVDELFDITSCYYPITFQSRPNSPDGITREQLVQRLRDVLTATSRFAPHMLGLLMEKLEAAEHPVKLDVLDTLSACVCAYDAGDLVPLVAALKARLLSELYALHDDELKAAGLKCVAALTVKFAYSHQVFVEPLCGDCLQEMKVPDGARAKWAIALLQVVASTSDDAGRTVWRCVKPAFTRAFHQQQLSPTQRQTWIHHLHQLVAVTSTAVLRDHVDECVGMLGSSIGQGYPEMRAWGLETMTRLATLHLLTTQQVSEWIVVPCATLVTDTRETVLFAAARQCMVELAPNYAPLVIGTVVPRLLDVRSGGGGGGGDDDDDEDDGVGEQQAMEVLQALTAVAAVAVPVLERFVDMMKTTTTKTTPGRVGMLLNTLHAMVVQVPGASMPMTVFDAVLTMAGTLVAPDHRRVARRLLNVLVARADDTTQRAYVQRMGDGDGDGEWAAVVHSSVRRPVDRQFDVWWRALQESKVCDVWAEALGAVVNKSDTTSVLPPATMSVLCSSRARVHIVALGWITRALLMRGDPRADILHGRLLQLLLHSNDDDTTDDDNHQVHNWAVAALGVVVGDGTLVGFGAFTHAQSGGRGAFLYAQRCFVYSLPWYLDAFARAPPPTSPARASLLRALAQLVTTAPHGALVEALPSFLTLLIEALLSDSLPVQACTLRTLVSLIRGDDGDPSFLATHASAVIPRLLALSRPPTGARDRILSLWCLEQCARLPYHLLYPMKLATCRGLRVCLDDPKRAVRKFAVRCSNRWAVLNASATITNPT